MLFDDTIYSRGFEARATAIAIRTIGGCYVMKFRPDTRPLVGIGLFHVVPEGDGYAFSWEARALREGELPEHLLPWLEERLPQSGAVISYNNFGSVPRRLAAIAPAVAYPQVAELAADTSDRWRDLPRGYTWHLKQAPANPMPCLCPAGCMKDCKPELPIDLLPDPELAELQLVQEAAQGWVAWANLFGDYDDAAHPARRALKALAERKARALWLATQNTSAE